MPIALGLFIVLKILAIQSEFEFDFTEWPADQVNAARNVSESHELSTTAEKEVIFYCNLVRINGPLFEKTILKQYLEHTDYSEYKDDVVSLQEDLRKLPVNKMPILRYNKRLYQAAKKYALEAGVKGVVGHDNYDERMRDFDERSRCSGENCHYGNDDPFEAFISLLIDNGVLGYGHRRNILYPDFLYVGIALEPHKIYGFNLVMDFACGEVNN